MKVVGIDVAPAKPSYVFYSGSPCKKDARQLLGFLERLTDSDEEVLVCWDSPLTGTQAPDSREFRDGDHTQRRIEAFFNRQKWGFKVPKGISVRSFGGCPHWTISRRLTGLPRVGPWDISWDDLPFELVSQGHCPKEPGHYIVEVHPGLALWLWCNTPAWTEENWEYKKDKQVLNRMWEELQRRFPNDFFSPLGVSFPVWDLELDSDDKLDCFVAWLLGVLWCQGSDEVILLGNRATGSMLLPNVSGLEEKFREFLETCDIP